MNEAEIIAKNIHIFLKEYAPLQKTNSSHTLKSYEYALILFISFLETEKKITPKRLTFACFSKKNIEEWLNWLIKKRGCSPETCNNRLASLRVFLKYLGSKEVTPLNLYAEAKQIPLNKIELKKVKGISKKGIQLLLSAPNLLTKAGRRDLALMIILYSTAARIDELLSLKIEQLHLNALKPYLTFNEGNKKRTMTLVSKAASHLKKFIEEFHGDEPDPQAYVFYSRNGGLHTKMSQNAVNKQLKKHAMVAHETCEDVPCDLHAHQLRHAKAIHWLEDGMNIMQISFLLGHEQLQTTMRYMDIPLK